MFKKVFELLSKSKIQQVDDEILISPITSIEELDQLISKSHEIETWTSQLLLDVF